jgi:ferredoxin
MTKIYYFSGTGNTLWSARRIAELLVEDGSIKHPIGVEHPSGAGAGAGVFNISREMRRPRICIEADAAVIMFPAYAYQMPLMVRRFLVKADIRAPYIAALVTYGSSPGGALAEASRILTRKKTPLSFAGGIPCVENYIPIFGVPSEKTRTKRLAMQEAETEARARDIRARKICREAWTFRPFSVVVSTLFRIAKTAFVKGYAVTERCNGCGLCASLCPAHAIAMEERKPVFSSACEHCQACLNWCPARAIRYIRITPDSERYHHPDIRIGDMAVHNL